MWFFHLLSRFLELRVALSCLAPWLGQCQGYPGRLCVPRTNPVCLLCDPHALRNPDAAVHQQIGEWVQIPVREEISPTEERLFLASPFVCITVVTAHATHLAPPKLC